ncbi:cytochrome P450 3A17 [Microdochium trichocladiopsis]|uniref:Cytochrome P450 3A17 n=1 Tax=Microdochium trichocladiopsis TaxID=1682393 RepID=A0A9P8Y1M1_9PEZI|nr:cytochrome P450 3A17 [Microdochium trichocladiopsis]KAH7027229.1 cytochrome P450 3A17 [Microdochium trichocladiopsis]
MDAFREPFRAALTALAHPSGLTILALVSAAAITATAIYRVWFHPLSAFPGPKRYAITDVPQDWQVHVRGTFQPRLRELHQRYGPVVRIGPDTLSVDGGVAWPQVYGHRRAGQPEFGKVAGYFGPENDISVLMAPQAAHRRQRRHLAHACSDAALAEQQGFVLKYVDLVMEKFSRSADAGEHVNVVDWLNFMTFDVIGDLAFGESFGSLGRSEYHPWVRAIVDSFYGFSLVHFIQFHPFFLPVLPLMVGTKFFRQIRKIQVMSRSKAQARIDRGETPGRRDLMSYVSRKTLQNNGKEAKAEAEHQHQHHQEQQQQQQQGMTRAEQLVVAPLLVTAGSDTTATALSGFFFLLAQHPDAMRRLQEEVRGAFASEAEVDIKSSARLPYLSACLEETMRLYPPAVVTPPRVSPGAEIEGRFVPKGTRIFVPQYVTFRNENHFTDPDSFRPERWLPATHPLHDPKYAGDNRAVFKPFSFGPRDCIGKNLAVAEMRIFAARLALRFDWELPPGQGRWMEDQRVCGAWMKGPLQVRLAHRG